MMDRRMSNPDGPFTRAATKVFSHIYDVYYPFVALSRRAISFMLSQRQLEALRLPNEEDVVHCENFTRSALMNGGFNCLPLYECFPGCYDRSLMENGPKNARTLGAIHDVPPELEMIHPVFTAQEFLERIYVACCGKIHTVDQAIEILFSNRVSSIDAELLNVYVKKLEHLRENQESMSDGSID
jgi:hypothetical protein